MAFSKTLPFSIEKMSLEGSETPTKIYVTEDYLNLIKKHTTVLKYKEHHTRYQEITMCIKKFVEDLYRKRANLKKELKQLEKQEKTQESIVRIEQLNNQQTGIKIVLNSLYGKFCEKPHHTQCFYSNLNNYKFERYAVPNPEYRCILSGCYIIYESRLKLLDKIIKCSERG